MWLDSTLVLDLVVESPGKTNWALFNHWRKQYGDLSSRIGLYATEHNQLKKQVSLCKAYVRLAMDLIINPTDITIDIYIHVSSTICLTTIETLHKFKSHIKYIYIYKRI